MSFTESNTVEQMILDAATSLGKGAQASGLRGHRQDACATLHEELPAGWGGSLGKEFKPAKWTFVEPAKVPRQPGDVMVETWVREALIALNPEIAAQPDRADEVIYALRAILLAVDGDGLVRANENFTQWLRGEKTMPFGPDGEHVPVRLIDFGGHSQDGCATLLGSRNRLTVTNQWTYRKGDTGFQPVTHPPRQGDTGFQPVTHPPEQGDTGFQPVTSPIHPQNGGAPLEKRFDLVFLVNGLPLVIGEAKTPTRSSVTWFDGAHQVNEIYEKEVPAMFVPNVFSFATEGRCLRFGSIRMPIDLWGPWRLESPHPSQTSLPSGECLETEGTLDSVRRDVSSLLRPEVVLDILQHFTLFATDKKHRRIKVICRYQQYETTNKIVARVVAGYPKKGLIWHFQGSGKSLLMVFAAQKLRLHPRLGNPAVLIVVDRIDLDTQITATFNAADVPNMVGVGDRKEMQRLLNQDVRKVLITTIHKFGGGEDGGTTNFTKSTNQENSEDSCQFVPFVVNKAGAWNQRSNIIVMVDEAHRTQEGDLGRKMRDALPNAFLFGLTGTPINRADRNTFWAFGADEDVQGYMSRYSFQDSIRDKATLPLHFEAPTVKLKIDKEAIDEAYRQITGDLNEQDRDDLAKRAAKMARMVKSPKRVRAVVEHIVEHYQTKVEPNGFKAQVVCFDRECCVLYKAVMDELIGPDSSIIVMSSGQKDPPEWKAHLRDKDTEEKLLDRFRSPTDPLIFVIVTNKLLTGFDAPILQAMYLDKPMKDHNLLQAICRVNRTYGQSKTHGLIVDYIGIFDDVAKALDFDEKAVQQVVSNIDELRKALPVQTQKCLAFFPDVDRSVGGYEGLMAAQQCLPNNATRDKFAAEYNLLGTIWEALSPDPCLRAYAKDYKWLTQVYESVKPVSGTGKLLWHRLGAKTIELINENIHVEAVRDDIDALVLDADVLDSILNDANPAKKATEVEIKLVARLRKHAGNPKFTELGERLEKIREKHEQGLINSLEFLKGILEIAKDVVEAENRVDPEEEHNQAIAALTELFNEAKSKNTHVIVERIVTDIDAIVKQVRFPDWQNTTQGEREVQQALRRALLKYRLHTDQELFDKAYGYIRQYY